ncbi:MAG: serine/threonine-protein kinase, partial [Planctomycetota bacterium]
MARTLSDVESEFRQKWQSFDMRTYDYYLDQVDKQDREELLVKLIIAELEFRFDPPPHSIKESDSGEDSRGIPPTLNLILPQFPSLCKRVDKVMQLIVLEYALRFRHDPKPPVPESYLSFCEVEDDRRRLCELMQQVEITLPNTRKHQPPPASRINDSTVRDKNSDNNISLEMLPATLGNYLLVDFISSGGMGVVYSAIDLRNAAPVAVKVMRRDDPWSIYRFIEEFSWLSHVSHPNLVRLYDACLEGDYRYFSMELVEGRSVDDWYEKSIRSRKDPWTPLKKVLVQAASALQFLHHNNILHCDVKCSNLMITSKKRAVLLDLGLAVREGGTEKGLGTLQYMAPEIVKTQQHTQASDWYSFGLMIYEILAGNFNPKICDVTLKEELLEPGALSRIDDIDLREQLQGADSDLIDLCCDLLNPAPLSRPQGDEVIARLGGSNSQNLIDHQTKTVPVASLRVLLRFYNLGRHILQR